jgi:hypothetical protein
LLSIDAGAHRCDEEGAAGAERANDYQQRMRAPPPQHQHDQQPEGDRRRTPDEVVAQQAFHQGGWQ